VPDIDTVLLGQLALDRGRYRENGFDAALDAIEALGVVESETIARWRSSTQNGAIPGVDRAGPTLEAVQARIKEMLTELGCRTSESEEARRRFFDVANAATSMEFVDREVMRVWREETYAPPSGEGRRRGRFTATFGMQSLGDLVAVRDPPSERKGGFRPTAIELFSEGVLARWQHIQPEPDYDGAIAWPGDEVERVLTLPPTEFRLSDDLGTNYSRGMGGTRAQRLNSGCFLTEGISTFEPAVPDAARRLRLLTDRGEFDVDLEGTRA